MYTFSPLLNYPATGIACLPFAISCIAVGAILTTWWRYDRNVLGANTDAHRIMAMAFVVAVVAGVFAWPQDAIIHANTPVTAKFTGFLLGKAGTVHNVGSKSSAQQDLELHTVTYANLVLENGGGTLALPVAENTAMPDRVLLYKN